HRLHFHLIHHKFLPNISIPIPIFHPLTQQSHFPIHLHLIIHQPQNYINLFPEHRPHIISLHVQSTTHIHTAIQQIKQLPKKPRLLINPPTS
ncbi:beta/alpha barrel domain-containing protein, partial [Staphylococcus epidermidis]